ncbi:MAG: EAL domain-containing protein, partial [Candidatus Limnocylindrales bacterium]
GGDEFALLLPGTDEESARQIAERVRLAIAAVGESGTSGVTASVGLASSPRDADGADTLVARTDAALYRAKGSGTDRVETARETHAAPRGRLGRGQEIASPRRTIDPVPSGSTARRPSLRRTKRGALGSRRRSVAREKSGAAERLRTALDTMLAGVSIQSALRDGGGCIVDFRIDYSNAAMGMISRVAPDEQIGHRLLELFPAHRTNGLFDAYVRVVETGVLFASADFRYLDPDAPGGPLDQILDLRAVKMGDGYMLSVRDVTEHNRAELEMRRLSTAIEQSADAVVITDTDARIEYVNPAFEHVTGYRRDEVLGQNPRILKSGVQGPSFYAEMWASLTSGRSFVAEMTNRRKDGSLFQEETVISPISGIDGAITSYVAVKRDVTRDRDYEAAQKRQARERALVAGALADLQAGPTPADTAEAICRHVVRLAGLATATLLYFSVGGPAIPLAFVRADGVPVPLRRLPFQRSRRLHERAEEGPWVETWVRRPWHPYDLLFRDLSAQAMAYVPVRHGRQLIGLLIVSSAEANAISVHTEHLPALVEFAGIAGVLVGPSIVTLTQAGFAREGIRRIITDRAFKPVFQPIVDIATGAHVGYEALTRFANGTPPDVVFLNAHASGLEAELEETTLAAALSSAAALPDGTWLSLNVSPDLAMARRLGELLAHATRPIVLEVTEHAPVNDYAALRASIDRLHPAVRVAVDDTGSGVANFGHLVELRPAFVKLDVGLVRGIDTDRARQALMVGLLHFARESASQTIAEGVETAAELDALRKLGVPLAQGYLLGRPAPAIVWQE